MAKELLVRTYEELRQFVEAFAAGHYELLVLVGDPGTGKSETRRILQNRLGDKWGLLTGYHTDLDLYRQLYGFRYYPVAMDDIDPLFDGNVKTALLKAVCDTKPVKRIEWGSTHWAFSDEDNGLPNMFESISRVMIIANDLKKLTKNLGAILDRGMVIRFAPGAMNLHVEVANGGWFDDREVYREIGKYLHLMVHPSFRFYLHARANKRAGLDWKALLVRQLEEDPDDGKLIVAAKIMNDPQVQVRQTARGGIHRASRWRLPGDVVSQKAGAKGETGRHRHGFSCKTRSGEVQRHRSVHEEAIEAPEGTGSGAGCYRGG